MARHVPSQAGNETSEGFDTLLYGCYPSIATMLLVGGGGAVRACGLLSVPTCRTHERYLELLQQAEEQALRVLGFPCTTDVYVYQLYA